MPKVQEVAQQAMERLLIHMELLVLTRLVVVDIHRLRMGKWVQLVAGYLVTGLVFRKV